ncbi:MAG: LysR family transcriptional regulator [Pseudomonadota bacterium]
MSELDWNNLRVVLAISRTGSLKGAATHLHLDQTTAGRRLTALEQDIGARLFRRSKSGFVITKAGEVVVGAAKAVENRLEAMAQNLVPDGASNEGIVRLLGNNWMMTALAGKALPALFARHPGLEVRFVGRLPPAPIYGEPTVALWFDANPRAPDQARPIAKVPYAAYRAKAHRCADTDWVVFRDDDATGPSFTRVVTRKIGPDARIRMTGTDASHLAAAIGAGIGQGVLPVCLGDNDDRLERSDALAKPIVRTLHLHTSPEFEGRARQKTILDWLNETLFDTIAGTRIDAA